MKIVALFAVGTLLAITGCAVEQGDDVSVDDGQQVAAGGDELSSTGGFYTKGTELTTTATSLNFRAGPSRTDAILRTLPFDTQLLVLEDTAGSAWAHVQFGSQAGYVYTAYVSEVDDPASGTTVPSADVGGSFSRTKSLQLAATAQRVDGHPSGGYCAREVGTSVERSGILDGAAWVRKPSAAQWGDWAAANPKALANIGFQQISVPSIDAIPKGAIIQWEGGQCGYSASYGHIEIVVTEGATRACSDFCGRVKRGCGLPRVFVAIN